MSIHIFMFIKCDIPGIVSPCKDDVGDISAPVDINKIFLKFPSSNLCIIKDAKTEALQPHPEPPA